MSFRIIAKTNRLLLLFVISTLSFSSASVRAASGWYDFGWAYRRSVVVTNTCGAELADHQVRIDLDSSFDFGKAESDGSDVRITADDGVTAIPFWIEVWDDAGQTASLWISAPSIPVGTTTVYLYYGSSAATSKSDGTATFTAYDGFEGNDVGNAPVAGAMGSGTWTKDAANPIMTCDRCGFGSTFYDSGTGTYHHFNSWQTILHHTSNDGKTWTADDANNPVLTPTETWEGSNVGVPMVWKEGSTWYMLYRGGSPDRIGLATSSDAVNWTKSASNPVLSGDSGEWDDRDLDPWGVIKVGSTYYLWYNTIGSVPGLGRCTGLATSTNLTDWTKDLDNPIFTGGRFCAFPFKHDGDYYLLIPHYTSGSDYSQIELYRDSSPTFHSGDRKYLGVAINYGPTDWDDHDQDTPAVLTDTINRDTFTASNGELWAYYSGEGGSGSWQTGVCTEENIAEAIAGVEASFLNWSISGDVTVVDSPVRQGSRSVRQRDTSASASVTLTGSFSEQESGVVGAWMRRSSTSSGDYDIYLYGGATLSCVAGLGRNGDFHYWNGSFQPTAVSWSPDTWYLVTLAFDATTDLYDFVVYDESMTEVVRVEGISFGNAASFIDSAMLYTSSGFLEDGHADDFRIRQWCGSDQGVAVGGEETNAIPTMNEWGMIWLVFLLVGSALFVTRRRNVG